MTDSNRGRSFVCERCSGERNPLKERLAELRDTDFSARTPADTSSQAFYVQCEVLRRLSAGQRLQRAFDLCDLADEFAVGGIRQRHPDYDSEKLRFALIRIRLGDELFRKAYPGVDVEL